MANRAYLFASNTAEPEVWEKSFHEPYYDSRHGMPLGWFFFFGPGNIQMINVKSDYGSEWQEVKLFVVKSEALELFKSRYWTLIEIAARLNASYVDRLFSDVQAWPGHYLLMNPVEVVEDDEDDARRFAEILTAIDTKPNNPATILQSASYYMGHLDDIEENRLILNVVGATYWP
jgi:hypothetical protein